MSATKVQAGKLPVASQRFATCEPASVELRTHKLRVASLRHCETKCLRVWSQRAYELQSFDLTISKAAIQP